MDEMGQRLYLGRGLHRLLYEIIREIAGDDLSRAKALLHDLHAEGVISRQAGGYSVFDTQKARDTITGWLGTEERSRLRERLPEAFLDRLSVLRIWETAHSALPVSWSRARRFAPWVADLGDAGLLIETHRGVCLSASARLAVWMLHDLHGQESLSEGDILLLRSGVTGLRNRGEWFLAARLSDALLDRYPKIIQRHPGFAITAALGFAQAQDLERTLNYVALLKQLNRPMQITWRSRVMSLEAFALSENGDPDKGQKLARRAGRLTRGPTERVLAALSGTWSDVRKSNGRRALRMLTFLEQALPAGETAIRSVVIAWNGSAHHDLELFEESLRSKKRSLGLALEAGWKDRLRSVTINEANNAVEQGDYPKAKRMLSGLISRLELEGRFKFLPSLWSHSAAAFDITPGDLRSWWAHNRAVALSEFTGSLYSLPSILGRMAHFALRTGRWREALEIFKREEQAAIAINQISYIGSARFHRSRLEYYGGQTELAWRSLESALEVFREIDYPTRIADVHRQRAEFLLDQGLLDEAGRELELADSLYSGQETCRERDLIPLLWLEHRMRSDPGSISFSDLDPVRSSRNHLNHVAALAQVVLAVGFAILDDSLNTRLYSKEALSALTKNKDIYQNRRALNLAQSTKKRSTWLEYLVSFWMETLELPT